MSAPALSASTALRARFVVPLGMALFAAGGAFGYLLSGGDAAAPPPIAAAAIPAAVAAEPTARAPAPPSAPAAARYVPLYRIAGREFGVSWLLLASIHSQETAFSTADDTYRGRNFAGCCAGPMQFNVRDGSPTMWHRFRGAFERAPRPAAYPHATAAHPSVYDDFDAMMAAASLLQANGATEALDATAWRAAYSYYGYDANGIDYANEVLARAVTWSRTGFDPGATADAALVAEYESLYGGWERDRLDRGAGGDREERKARRGHKRDQRSQKRGEDRKPRDHEPRRQTPPDQPERTVRPPPATRDAEPAPPKPPPRPGSGPPPRSPAEPEAGTSAPPAQAP